MTKEKFIERVSYYLSDEYLEEKKQIAIDKGFQCPPDWFAKVVAFDMIESFLEEVEL